MAMVTTDSVNIPLSIDDIQFPYGSLAECLLDFSVLAEARDIQPYDVSSLSQLLLAGERYVQNPPIGLGFIGEKGVLADILTIYYGTCCIPMLGRMRVTTEQTTEHILTGTVGLSQNHSKHSSLSFREEMLFDLITQLSFETGKFVYKKLTELLPGQRKVTYSRIAPYGVALLQGREK